MSLAMHDRGSAQTLENALRAALLARSPALPVSDVGRDAFEATVRSCTEADLAFQRSIGATLAPAAAREVLAATSSFRARVRAVRSRALAETLHVAGVGTGDSFADPLDVVTPRISNLSHVAAVRLADVSDRARAEVAVLRRHANERIEPVLTTAARSALIEAKRARLVAFRGAVHAALVPFASRVDRFSDTVESRAAGGDPGY
jgi:hypothetical protein